MGGHGALLRPRAEVGIVEFVPVRDPVALRLTVEDRVEERGRQALGNARRKGVAQHDDAELLVGKEIGDRTGPRAEGAGMAPFDAMRTIGDTPTQRVEPDFSGARIDAAHAGRNMGLREGRSVDDLAVPELALGELEPEPLGKVARAGACAAGRRLRVGIASRERGPLAVDPDVQRGAIGTDDEIAVALAGRGHAERLLEAFLCGLRPILAPYNARGCRALRYAGIHVL